ncbi:MAG: hypothetical protein KAS32_30485 [Candidatus Peribacteraceae bacterium]|nr:hypothetical protein [Candidatus Peribacteraceae bacterium]
MDEIKKIMADIEKIDLNYLKREGQELNFKDIHGLVLEIFDNLKYLTQNQEVWNHLTDGEKTGVKSNVRQFTNHVNNMGRFTAMDNNAANNRNSISLGIRTIYGNLYNLIIQRIEIDKLKKTYNQSDINGILKKLKADSKTAENKLKNIEVLETEIQKSASKEGTHEFAEIFSQESNKKQRASNWWLGASIVSIILALVYVFYSFGTLAEAMSKEKLEIFYQIAAMNVLILSTLLLIVRQFIKNYNANKHLHIMNEHRANCLKTFKLFVGAAGEDKVVQNAILVQATKSIFESGETGYVNSNYRQSGSILSDIVELVKK